MSKRVLRTQSKFKKQLLRALKGQHGVRPPALGYLHSGGGSTSPSPGLKCPVWQHVLALVLGKGVKGPGRVVGSVQSPRSNVRRGQGLEGL